MKLNDVERKSLVLVEVRRGSIVESSHRGLIAVTDKEGNLIATSGDAETVIYTRSTAKPIQALPLLMHGGVERYQLTDEEIAIICSSHNGEDKHVQAVSSILNKIGMSVSDLLCGVHRPWDRQSSENLYLEREEPTTLHNNCSGKHAGMLALCRILEADHATYLSLDHPVQGLIRDALAQMSGLSSEQLIAGIDGCGVPVFALPIRNLAQAMAQLGSPKRLPTQVSDRCKKIVQAMVTNPDYVAGKERFETDLMKITNGKIVAKSGAEGMIALAIPEKGWGIVIKMMDGASRGVFPATVEALRQLELINQSELEQLHVYHSPVATNWAGTEVGRTKPVFQLR